MPSPSRSRRPRTCRSRRTPSGTCRPHLHGKMPSPVGSASEGHGGIGRTGPQRWRLVGPDAAFAARGPPAHALRISATTVVVTFRGHSSRRTRLTRLATPALAVLLGAACASTDPTPAAGTRPLTPASSATTSAQPTSEEAPVTTVRISLGDRTFMAQLADNPTARDLVDQLPLTLRFRDFNRVEKIAELAPAADHGWGARRRRPRDQRHRLLRSLARSRSLLRRCGLLQRDRTDRPPPRGGHERHRAPTGRVRTDDGSRLRGWSAAPCSARP